VIPQHALERSPAPDTTAGFVARHEHIWLGLMLLTLHAATAWGIGAAWSSALLVAHFGLFLMWQPLWQGDGKVEARHVILMVLVGTLLATAGSWWLHALWLTALTALIGGGVPGLTAQRQRSASMLAALYVLALLLMWVVPQLSGQPVVDVVLTNLVRYGLPLIAAAILLVRPAPPRDGASVAVDLFYSVMLFLLVAALVLGSLVMVKTVQGQYLVALAQTLLLIAVALAGLSWLMSPKAGFAGFDQMLSRYLLSVGLPFEQWVQRLADIAQRENEPPQFLQATMAHLQALPWVSGLQWETPQDTGTSGRLRTSCGVYPRYAEIAHSYALAPVAGDVAARAAAGADGRPLLCRQGARGAAAAQCLHAGDLRNGFAPHPRRKKPAAIATGAV
jgi:hypothetical protein